VPWEEIRAVAGWLGMVSFVIVLAITEHFRRTFATKEDCEDSMQKEEQERKLADKRIEDRMADISQSLHSHMGKFDLLRDEIHDSEMRHLREVSDLKTEIRTGFAEIKSAIKSQGGRGEIR
jgi:hypothetical protein